MSKHKPGREHLKVNRNIKQNAENFEGYNFKLIKDQISDDFKDLNRFKEEGEKLEELGNNEINFQQEILKNDPEILTNFENNESQ